VGLTLVLGGVRSGKSERAEALAAAGGRSVTYLATADPTDLSMRARMQAHRSRRPASWRTVQLGATGELPSTDSDDGCWLLDGLGVWLSRLDTEQSERAVRGLIDAARRRAVIVVAEEAGLGVLPAAPVARAWLDRLGEANRRLAACAERVELVVAGRPLVLDAAAGSAVGPPMGPGSEAAVDAVRLVARVHGDRLLGPGLVDHAVNVLAGGPDEELRAHLHAVLDRDAGAYPDEREAVAALAAHHGRGEQEVVPTSGATAGLWLVAAALRPRLAAVIHPAFSEGEVALRAHGIPVTQVVRTPERDFALEPAAVPDQADLVLTANPLSPSGTLDSAEAVLALRRPGRVVVVDEAFMDFAADEPHSSLAGCQLPDVIVLRSLTKILSIPGLRAGYALAPPTLAARLRAASPPWSVSALATAALAWAASHPAAIDRARRRASAEREDLARGLAKLDGVRCWPSAANFCLIEVADGDRIARRLRAAGIAVRPCGDFLGLDRRHVRLTARDPASNRRLLEELKRTLAEVGT